MEMTNEEIIKKYFDVELDENNAANYLLLKIKNRRRQIKKLEDQKQALPSDDESIKSLDTRIEELSEEIEIIEDHIKVILGTLIKEFQEGDYFRIPINLCISDICALFDALKRYDILGKEVTAQKFASHFTDERNTPLSPTFNSSKRKEGNSTNALIEKLEKALEKIKNGEDRVQALS